MPRRRSLQPDDPRGPSFIPVASTSELEQTQDSRDLMFPADVKQPLVIKEEVPWSSSVDQQDPELVQIKEEEEDPWTNQEKEQLHGQVETDITRLSLTVVTVKSEDEEKPQPSQFNKVKTPTSSSAEQMKTETDEEDYEGPEPARNPNPHDHLQSNINDKTSDSSETEVSDDDYWQKSGAKTEDSYKDSGQMMVLESSVKHVVSDAAKISFSSSDCGKQFVNKTRTRVHTGAFCCTVCDKTFSRQGTLLKHMRIHTGEKPFCCDVCGKRFRERGFFSKHMRVHTGEKPFSCEVCSKTFTQKTHLQKHTRVHTGEKPFGCDVCGKNFCAQGALSCHMRVHTGEKPFGCHVCGKKFSRNEHLKIHMRVHTEEKPQPSQFNMVKTPTSSSAEQMKTGTDEEDYEGPEPPRNPNPHGHSQLNIDDKTSDSSETEVSDDDYWQKSGPKTEDRYKDSGQMMVLESSVKYDVVSDAAKISFSSSDCGKQFVNKTRTRVHTGAFSCTVCDKTFSRQGALLSHMTVHRGEKPFGCNVCGKTFSERGTLSKHVGIHAGEKPFVCDCGKRFSGRGNLSRHMKVHTGEKHFALDECGKS